nr:toll/interleukin-1 receptor domain-containing protein [uncultured Draconibacterium sp.]
MKNYNQEMKIFVSYSHQNSEWVSDSGKYPLIPWLKEQLVGQAEIWTDHALKQMLGEDYTKLISSKINEADIAILLISQEFARPGYIHNVEMPLMKERYNREELKIIPLLISRLSKKGKENVSWIFDLQTYPNDTKPLLSFVNDDAQWADIRVDILDGIETKIEQIKERKIRKNTSKQVTTTKPSRSEEVVEDKLSASELFSKAYSYDINKEYLRALKWYLKAAEKGNAVAMKNIGFLYRNGEGVDRDYKKAMDWYLKAAEKGNAGAMNNIGFLFDTGKGVDRDYKKAMDWYLKAAEKGNAVAMNNIGFLFDTGKGVDRDYKKAMDWYLKAAEKGNAVAMKNIGFLYRNGEGVDRDYKKAMDWYLKAAEKGNAEAMKKIGFLFDTGKGVDRDYKKAMDWYLKAAEKGNAEAMKLIGVLYRNGEGVDRDYKKAMDWYLKAAEKGNAEAMKLIGVLYKNGEGVPQSTENAELWFEKARKNGYKD